MAAYILDTNLFFNLQAKTAFGTNPQEIIISVTNYAQKLKSLQKAEFYMPPRVLEEFLTFVDESEEYVHKFIAQINIKAPDKSKTQFATEVFYDLIEEIRHRSYRGLQVAEEEMAQAVAEIPRELLEPGAKIEYQKAIGEHIKRLRDRYRNATRTKFLDSLADLDIIVLAKELNGAVVTADEGVLLWARKFGVKEAIPHVLHHELDALLAG